MYSIDSMTTRTLRFYFDYISPYAYLAWHRLQTFAPEHGLDLELRPTVFAGLLNEHGHKGPAEIEPKRLYMFRDCTRLASTMGVPFEPPASHPFNPLAALRASVLDMPESVRRALVSRLFAATWAESRDVGKAEVVGELCDEVGVPDAISRIQDPAIKQRLRDNGEEAIAHGAFGVPTFIVDGELFFGNDSFPHMARYLAGDDPFDPATTERWKAVRPSARR
jgi:2-hydroxychromene-2-carboxylate isomerase